jgi:hypothetical protein
MLFTICVDYLTAKTPSIPLQAVVQIESKQTGEILTVTCNRKAVQVNFNTETYKYSTPLQVEMYGHV